MEMMLKFYQNKKAAEQFTNAIVTNLVTSLDSKNPEKDALRDTYKLVSKFGPREIDVFKRSLLKEVKLAIKCKNNNLPYTLESQVINNFIARMFREPTTEEGKGRTTEYVEQRLVEETTELMFLDKMHEAGFFDETDYREKVGSKSLSELITNRLTYIFNEDELKYIEDDYNFYKNYLIKI